MIKQMKGVPGVMPARFQEGMDPRHCALSLVGEPIMYPEIGKFVNALHERRISTFLVTNAQFPDAITAGTVPRGLGILGSGILGLGILGSGILGSGILGSGILGLGILGSGILGSGILGSGILGSGILGSGILGSGILGLGILGLVAGPTEGLSSEF
jgi:hypothetical protein